MLATRIRNLFRLTIILALTIPAVAQTPVPTIKVANANPPTYIFCSFRGNGEDGLHLAWSLDGFRWTALKGDKSFLAPTVGGKLMRDPCICRGPDGTFHLVWTSGWYEQIIGYANSKDLIHWSEPKSLPVMTGEPTARNSWAPEIVYDAAKQQFIIFWATTITGRFPDTDNSGDNGLNHRIYCTTTKDFNEFTSTKVFFDPGFNCIDATMVPIGGKYCLVFKDETLKPEARKNLRTAWSDSPEGPFKDVSTPFTPSWVEGPTVLKVGDEYVCYFDRYRDRKYGVMTSMDLKKWDPLPDDQFSLPTGTRHGTAFSVDRSILVNLMKADAAANP